jgi:hypothetical protein
MAALAIQLTRLVHDWTQTGRPRKLVPELLRTGQRFRGQ